MGEGPPPGPKRVAFVLPSFAGGGAERVVLTLAASLDRARFAPEIIALDGAGPWRSLVPAEMPVSVLGVRRIRGALVPLARALRRRRPHIALSTIGALNLGLLALAPLLPRGIRLVVREANTPHRHAGSSLGARVYRFAYPRLYRRAARVIVPATYLARELAEDFGVPREKIAVLHNPVDAAALRAAAAEPRRAPGPGPRFVAVGRLAPQKAFDRLLAAMADISPAAELTILGDGPERAALEALRARLGLAARVAMPGFDSAAAPHVAGADALVLPSRWEGMPNVALEALALGTRVIATPEAGGIAEIAALAAPGAVTLARAGTELAAAMAAISPDPVAAPRPSLLPGSFALEGVAARFAALLDAV